VKRFLLPAQALSACIRADHLDAIRRLREAREHCATYVFAEVALDVGTSLIRAEAGSVSERDIRSYISLSRTIDDWGLRYRVMDLRAELLRRIGESAESQEALIAARADVRELLERLPEEHRDVFLENPWVQAVQKYRLIP
jgi:hypothetical protein